MAKRKERTTIVIAGRTNAGKSSLLNLLSGQRDRAIVDPTPGTTADTVQTVMEIHDFGPVKVFDTAGIDEGSDLGVKKRQKSFEAIDEADLVMLVLDSRLCGSDREKSGHDISKDDLEIIERAQKRNKQLLIINNNFTKERSHRDLNHPRNLNYPTLNIDISDFSQQRKLIEFIKKNFKKETRDVQLLPFLKYAKGTGFVLLNIPMDEETPKLRLLRPQDMAMERLLRKFYTPVLYRMDLKKARSDDPEIVEAERKRFLHMVDQFSNNHEDGLQLIITDSQAMDIMSKWTPPQTQLTTFSIMMTDYMSNGNLQLFVDGLHVIPDLKDGDSILIAESCNHDRKAEDIGTVQLPRIFKEKLGLNINFEYSAGRVFPTENSLKKYKLIIHCGGCMIDKQKYMARLETLKQANIPITNYGVILSYFQGEEGLKKVLEPWEL